MTGAKFCGGVPLAALAALALSACATTNTMRDEPRDTTMPTDERTERVRHEDESDAKLRSARRRAERDRALS